MKNYESRIKALEQRLVTELDRLVIQYIVSEQKEYRVADTTYIRPESISHEEFIDEIKSKYNLNGYVVIIGSVLPSEDGKRNMN